MTHIILDDDQIKAVKGATGAIEIRDRKGNLVGYFSNRLGKDVVTEAKRRANSDGPWYTTEQVLAHLDSLEPE